MKKTGIRSVGLIVLLSLISGCVTNPDTKTTSLVLVSKKQEKLLGDELHKDILTQYRPYPDKELQLYVNLIGNEVAAQAARNDTDYQFTVLDSEDVNAFTGPSGHVYITKNMLAHLNKESHLAAVLAHEIGHVSARHTARKLSQKKIHTSVSNTIISLMRLIPTISLWGIAPLSKALEHSRINYIKGYGRKLELEADTLGAAYLARSGYQPEDMIEVLSILKDQELYLAGQIQHEIDQDLVISYHASSTPTHPRSDERLKAAIKVAENFLITQDPQADRRNYLTMIDGLNVESDQRYSMTPTSAVLQRFHKNIKGYFPDHFIAYKEDTLPIQEQRIMLPSDDQPQHLIAIDSNQEEEKTYDKSGKYSGTINSQAKSVLLVNVLTHEGVFSPRQFLNAYLERKDVEFERISGGNVKTPYGKGYFLHTVTKRPYRQLGFIGKPTVEILEGMQGVIMIGDDAIVIETFISNSLGVTKMPHQRIFKSVMRNIRPQDAPNELHDPVLKHSYGIALKVIEPGETFRSIASQLMLSDAETKLRLINGYYPSGEPDFGQTIKTFVSQ